jgi:glycosyltransferase involved in cell wall biosynthesis
MQWRYRWTCHATADRTRPLSHSSLERPRRVLDVSIIIPTHNRSALVTRVIDALLYQDTRADYEIVIVDSNSSDDTPSVLATYRDRDARIKTCRTDKPGASAARNAGLDAASGKLLILLDDDILVPRDFLSTALYAASIDPGKVLLGHIDALWTDSDDPFLRFLQESGDVNSYDFKNADDVPPNYFYTACVLIPRDVLGQTRFDENFTVYGIEDLDFGIRLLGDTRKMIYLPHWRVTHEYFPRFTDYRRKKFRTGQSLAYFIAKNPDNARYFYIEPTPTRRWFRTYRTLLAPVALIVYFLSRLLKRRGPISRLLYTWFYRDLRIRLFDGMRSHNAHNVQK